MNTTVKRQFLRNNELKCQTKEDITLVGIYFVHYNALEVNYIY